MIINFEKLESNKQIDNKHKAKYFNFEKIKNLKNLNILFEKPNNLTLH